VPASQLVAVEIELSQGTAHDDRGDVTFCRLIDR